MSADILQMFSRGSQDVFKMFLDILKMLLIGCCKDFLSVFTRCSHHILSTLMGLLGLVGLMVLLGLDALVGLVVPVCLLVLWV